MGPVRFRRGAEDKDILGPNLRVRRRTYRGARMIDKAITERYYRLQGGLNGPLEEGFEYSYLTLPNGD